MLVMPSFKRASQVTVLQIQTSPYLTSAQPLQPLGASSKGYEPALDAALKVTLAHSGVADSTVASPFQSISRHTVIESSHSISLIHAQISALQSFIADYRGGDESKGDPSSPIFHANVALLTWKLLDALLQEPTFKGNYSVEQFRRERVSVWLQQALQQLPIRAMPSTPTNRTPDDEDELMAIFHHLSTHNLAEASRIALQKRVCCDGCFHYLPASLYVLESHLFPGLPLGHDDLANARSIHNQAIYEEADDGVGPTRIE
jgi:hypothetical protein